MKTVVLVCDGMGDYPQEQLNGKTPLEAAKTPNMDAMAKLGRVGLAMTIPPGYAPASDVGNLSILGYDPAKYYSGRAPLEAANMGVELEEADVCFRCNLVTADGDKLVDYSAGHIKSEEAAALIKQVDDRLGADDLEFYPGIQYRHLAVFRNAKLKESLLKTACPPPHDIMGQSIADNWPKGPAKERLVNLMESSREVLAGHEVNKVRIDLKENPANMIWLWGQGTQLRLPSFQERFGITGSVISAVDLVKGAGRLAGLRVIEVPGATGYYDTNYQGKADYALESLKEHDFVFVHVEAADEAGHNGDLRQKIAAIENFDKHVVGTVLGAMKAMKNYRILLIPDHLTSVQKRTHVTGAVPFMICGKGIDPGTIDSFGESQAKASGWLVEHAHELLPKLLTDKTI